MTTTTVKLPCIIINHIIHQYSCIIIVIIICNSLSKVHVLLMLCFSHNMSHRWKLYNLFLLLRKLNLIYCVILQNKASGYFPVLHFKEFNPCPDEPTVKNTTQILFNIVQNIPFLPCSGQSESTLQPVSASVYAHGADLFVFVFQEAHIMIITFYLKASHFSHRQVWCQILNRAKRRLVWKYVQNQCFMFQNNFFL